MTTASVWDDPELRAGGDFITFDAKGDNVSGTVQAIRVKRWDDGKVSPEILLVTDDGEEKTMTAGQVQLKAKLAELRPESGDHIVVTLSEIEKRAGGKTLKHFTVESGKAKAAPAPATPAAAPAAAPADGVDPAAVAAALAGLTPEQRAALGM